jgi:hypothetical protein
LILDCERRGEDRRLPDEHGLMADIFNEIDEELRGDQVRKFWNRYSGLLLLIAVLIVVGVGGWRGWQYWTEQVARAEGDKYLAALQLSGKGDYTAAETTLQQVATTASGYRALAKLRLADDKVSSGDKAGALAAFDAVARDASIPTPLQGVAMIRAAYLALDLEDRAKLEARLKPIAVSGNPWRHAAREILAFAAFKAGDIATAQKLVNDIREDAETPADLNQRISVLSAVLDAARPAPVQAPAAQAPSPAAAPEASAPAAAPSQPAVTPAPNAASTSEAKPNP